MNTKTTRTFLRIYQTYTSIGITIKQKQSIPKRLSSSLSDGEHENPLIAIL